MLSYTKSDTIQVRIHPSSDIKRYLLGIDFPELAILVTDTTVYLVASESKGKDFGLVNLTDSERLLESYGGENQGQELVGLRCEGTQSSQE